MSNFEQLPEQPEVLDPRAFHTMFRLYTAVAASPLSRQPTNDELTYKWPLFEEYADDRDNLEIDFEVGNLREVFVTAGSVRSRAQLYLWNERMAEMYRVAANPTNNSGITYANSLRWGLPLAFVEITTNESEISEDSSAEDPYGQVDGYIEIYQQGVVTSDFNYGGTGPAEDPKRQAELLKVVSFLGLKPELVTTDDSDVRGRDFDNQDLLRFTDGLRNILAAKSNEIVL